MKIHNIFPISVMEFKIPLDPKKIKEDLDKYKNIMERPPLFVGDGDGISSYSPKFSILKNDEFSLLIKEFEKCLEEYTELIGLTEVRISNSWVSIMNENVGIREHRHPGSVVTGAYYPKKPTDSVELTLSNPLQPYKMCELYDKYTGYNTDVGFVPTQEGYLYLFPSWLEHGTNLNTTDERYVISFNTIHKGYYLAMLSNEYSNKTGGRE